MNARDDSLKIKAKRQANAKRQADLKARRRIEGRKPLELWPLPEHRQAIKDYAAKLDASS